MTQTHLPEVLAADAVGLGEMIASRAIHPREAVTTVMGQIERYEPDLNAVCARRYEQALREAERPLPASPLAGVPFLIKDMGQTVAGMPHTLGSPMRRDVIAERDSALVARYQAAGLLIVGQSNVPEFGASADTRSPLHGAARNPWDIARSPGGSSGGSGAAVAARYVPAAHGSDGGGSIRIPAAMCGLFGLKPTRARTPKGPRAAEGWFGLSVDHVLTRTVRDSAALLDIAAGPDPGAPYFPPPPPRPFLEEAGHPPGTLRIAVSTGAMLASKLHPEGVRAVEKTAQLLEDLGHRVAEARPAAEAGPLRRAMTVMVAADLARNIAVAGREAGRKPTEEMFDPANWALAKLGRRLSAPALAEAIEYVKNAGRSIAPFFDDYDILVEATIAGAPPLSGAMDPSPRQLRALRTLGRAPGRAAVNLAVAKAAARSLDHIPNTPLWNATGQPAMSVPLHWEDGLPVGVQFTARYGEESLLFRLASQLENARPWSHRLPPLLEKTT